VSFAEAIGENFISEPIYNDMNSYIGLLKSDETVSDNKRKSKGKIPFVSGMVPAIVI
jgi:hypothetical protein